MYLAHRLAWLWIHGTLPKFIDHINGDRLDCRIDNLRECSASQNAFNQRRVKGKSLAKGVRKTRYGTYEARICVNRQNIQLGNFKTETEAADAYWTAARHHFGEFACRD